MKENVKRILKKIIPVVLVLSLALGLGAVTMFKTSDKQLPASSASFAESSDDSSVCFADGTDISDLSATDVISELSASSVTSATSVVNGEITATTAKAAAATTAATAAASSAKAATSTTKGKGSTTAATSTTKGNGSTAAATKGTTAAAKSASAPANEIRAVWISCFELSMKSSSDKSKQAFTSKINTMFKNISAEGFNTVFVHVRAYSDAFYTSKYYPHTEFLSGTQGKNPGYDALSVVCSLASKYNLSVHAWINPFRVSSSGNLSSLSADNPAKKILTDGDSSNDSRVYVSDSGIYLNPASAQNHELIYNGMREIVSGYSVSGIHIDDYFYPTQSEAIDSVQYKSYTASGGKLSLSSWRRASVNSFVSGMYSAVKAANGSVTVSVSPSANVENDFDKYYADVFTWCAQKGYCDWIIPQVYYGFDHGTLPYDSTARQWSNMVTCSYVKIIYGLAAYKCGTADSYAGSGKNEWINNSDILSRELVFSRTLPKYNGFALFSYSYIWGEKTNNNASSELKSLRGVL